MLRTMPPAWKKQYRLGRKTLAKNGGPSLPENDPTPEQVVELLANTAGGHSDIDVARGDQRVPKDVRDAAMHGLRLSYENNYGGWEFFGIARAIQLATVPAIPMRSRQRMNRYLSDHRKDQFAPNFGNDENPSAGYMAWLNWGGDPAYEWVRAVPRASYSHKTRLNPVKKRGMGERTHIVWGGDPAKAWVMDTEKRMRRNGQTRRNPSDLERALAGDKNLSGARLMRADLSGLDLSKANLRGADLTGADLSEANLREAKLARADLYKANLRGADLSEASLYEANLREAYLSGANLHWADLFEANLSGASLSGANLRRATLYAADLYEAHLNNANLRGANLTKANLFNANLTGVNLADVDLSEALNVDKAILPNRESTRARSLGRMAGAILKAEKPDAPQRAADFKRRYPAEFERLKGDTQGRDLAPALRSSLRKKYETPFDWHITVGEYKSSVQRYCPTANRVLMFNLDLNDPQYTPRQMEFLAKLREVSTRAGHPSERKPYFTVGWVRLCANEEAQTVLIEEVQSDVSVVRKKLKDGSAPEGLQDYADVLAEFASIAERFYADAIGYVFMEAEKQGYTVEMLDYAAKQQFGSPRELYTDLPRSMGMRLGEVSKVVPAVGKAWSYKPNPRKKRSR